MTDTYGLSRKEHVLSKLEDGERLTDEDRLWAVELLSSSDLVRFAAQVGQQQELRADG
jgi:hypothetical protein